MEKKNIVVTGAAGFIGHHLVDYLKEKGNWVRGVDWKALEYPTNANEFRLLDLRIPENVAMAFGGRKFDEVYALAADMGGMGFIQDPNNQYSILYNNTMINFNTLETARKFGVKKLLFSSSACIYPNYKQQETNVVPLKESDAYPAEPQDTYGWEKLQMEHLCKAVKGIETRIVRFHNIYGPEGEWFGGREKAPAALSRKIAEAKLKGLDYIEIWGDGEQTRTFCYIDDCLKGLELIMNGSNDKPVNLGRDELVSMNSLADIISEIAGVKLNYKHVPGPQGVRGRNSDNTMFKELYGWTPEIDLRQGLEKTYHWIEEQLFQKE
jgi:nucleoside-diphosphate-sugar epimerase